MAALNHSSFEVGEVREECRLNNDRFTVAVKHQFLNLSDGEKAAVQRMSRAFFCCLFFSGITAAVHTPYPS